MLGKRSFAGNEKYSLIVLGPVTHCSVIKIQIIQNQKDDHANVFGSSIN